ncbi:MULTISPECIES: hypothetical protein [unclassified Leucobacter]|uniref:beta strand repeat-containing protein n=1 Tax=unclassified Leucobacter TaxID=2621730 RepID=UPI00165E1619|nr:MULTISPECIES: hypothetical protein [unclassified Leucobacter]MBC9937410.1 hypothetical protein [Leucobacter sp. cx-87]
MQTRPRHLVVPIVVALAAALLPASPAYATGIHDVADEGALRIAAATTPAGETIRLTADIGTTSARIGYLAFESGATLDLNGFSLATQSIALKPGTSFSIDDRSAAGTGRLDASYVEPSGVPYTPSAAISTTGAHLTIAGGTIFADASGTHSRAGIGGYPVPTAAPQGVTIAGGTVTATAAGGAGIGTTQNDIATGDFPIRITGGSVHASAQRGAGIGSAGLTSYARPTITVSGGVVDAQSVSGAGIGGGSRASAVNSINISDIVISGNAVVNARSAQAAGIGGGYFGSAKTVTIGAGAVVTAFSSEPTVPAIGAGRYGELDGALTVHGTLRVPASTFVRSLRSNLAGNTIGATGLITGSGGLRAQGVWNNLGAITLPNALVTAADINENHFVVALNGNLAGVPDSATRVLAPTFAAGDRPLPVLSSATGWSFAGWNTAADGSGEPFTEATVMVPRPEATGIDGTAVSLFAQWVPSRIAVSVEPETSAAGESITLSAECLGIDDVSLGDCTDDVTFGSDTASDVVTGNAVRATAAGTRTLTASGWGLSASTSAVVTPAQASQLQLTPSATIVDQFGELDFVSILRDEFGNQVADVSATAVLSSAPGGVDVNGNQLSFHSAGAFTITSAAGSLSATTQIEVTAAALASLVLTVPSSAAAGDTISLSAEGFAAGGQSLGDVTDQVTFASSEASDVLDGDQATVTRAGSRTFTATLRGDAAIEARAGSIVRAGSLATLTLQASANQVSQGSSVSLTATVEDAYGNTRDVSDEATFTSDHSRDVIDGSTVTFLTASSHVVTAEYGGASASVTIAVIPTPGAAAPVLSQTGTSSLAPVMIAAALLVIGGGALSLRLLRRRAN